MMGLQFAQQAGDLAPGVMAFVVAINLAAKHRAPRILLLEALLKAILLLHDIGVGFCHGRMHGGARSDRVVVETRRQPAR